MYLFHGSRAVIKQPDIGYSRTDIDFGAGFYCTEDETMACKWACNKHRPFLNIYECPLDKLRIKEFAADTEWLDFVVANRNNEVPEHDYSGYQVLKGPTADDKMFAVIEMLSDGYISKKNALAVLTNMNYSEQLAFIDQRAINENLRFVSAKELSGAEKQHYTGLFRKDRQTAEKRTRQMLREINGR